MSNHLPGLAYRPGLRTWLPSVDRELDMKFATHKDYLDSLPEGKREGSKMLESHWPPSAAEADALGLERWLVQYHANTYTRSITSGYHTAFVYIPICRIQEASFSQFSRGSWVQRPCQIRSEARRTFSPCDLTSPLLSNGETQRRQAPGGCCRRPGDIRTQET